MGSANQKLIEHIDSVYSGSSRIAEYNYEFTFHEGSKQKIMIANYVISPLFLPNENGDEVVQRGVVLSLEDKTSEIKLMKTLGTYMDPALAKAAIASNENNLGGVRQRCAILFADIRSFTSISERMEAADVVSPA